MCINLIPPKPKKKIVAVRSQASTEQNYNYIAQTYGAIRPFANLVVDPILRNHNEETVTWYKKWFAFTHKFLMY